MTDEAIKVRSAQAINETVDITSSDFIDSDHVVT